MKAGEYTFVNLKQPNPQPANYVIVDMDLFELPGRAFLLKGALKYKNYADQRILRLRDREVFNAFYVLQKRPFLRLRRFWSVLSGRAQLKVVDRTSIGKTSRQIDSICVLKILKPQNPPINELYE